MLPTSAVPLVLCGLVLALVSCSSAPKPASLPAGASDRAISSAQLGELHDAQQVLVGRCMRSKGFSYWLEPFVGDTEDREFPYVIDDVSWARRHGFGEDLVAAHERINRADPNQRYFRALPPGRRQDALVTLNGEDNSAVKVMLPNGITAGRNSGGCVSQAETELYGDLSAWFEASAAAAALEPAVRAEVLQDPRYQARSMRWAACMRSRDLRYVSPAAVQDALPALRALGREREIEVAVAEATCATTTGLGELATTLEQEHRAADSTRYPELTRYRQLQTAALPRARVILAGAR